MKNSFFRADSSVQQRYGNPNDRPLPAVTEEELERILLGKTKPVAALISNPVLHRYGQGGHFSCEGTGQR